MLSRNRIHCLFLSPCLCVSVSLFPMQAVTRKKRITAVDLRARVPAIARGLALFLLIGGGIFVGVSYYKMRNNTPFRLKSETPELSKEIVAVTTGYEQRITKNDRLYLWLRAARDVTYSD